MSDDDVCLDKNTEDEEREGSDIKDTKTSTNGVIFDYFVITKEQKWYDSKRNIPWFHLYMMTNHLEVDPSTLYCTFTNFVRFTREGIKGWKLNDYTHWIKTLNIPK